MKDYSLKVILGMKPMKNVKEVKMMSKKICYYEEASDKPYMIKIIETKKAYSFGSFLFDMLMLYLTQGLWIIWMIFRRLFT